MVSHKLTSVLEDNLEFLTHYPLLLSLYLPVLTLQANATYVVMRLNSVFMDARQPLYQLSCIVGPRDHFENNILWAIIPTAFTKLCLLII